MGMQGEAIQSGPNQPLAQDATKTAGGGTDEAAIGGVLDVNTTEYSTPADTAEHDAITYSLPANTLNANGKIIRLTAWGELAGNGNLKTIKLYCGSTAINNANTAAAGQTNFRFTADIIRTGAGAQESIGYSMFKTNTFGSGFTTPAEDETGAITLKITVQNGAVSAADIVVHGMMVEVLN